MKTTVIDDWEGGRELPLDGIIRTKILQCPPEESVASVARRMSEAGCSSIIVMEGSEPVGIWTERDALGIDFGDPSAVASPIRAVMSSPVKSVPRSASLQEVAVRFRTDKVRHYLVVDEDGSPLGVITQTDVVMNQGIEHYLHLRSVDTAVHRKPLLLDEETPLPEAARQMHHQGADSVLVTFRDGGMGILTERDVVRLIASQRVDILIGSVASRPLITISSADSLLRARNTLALSGVRHIGVLDIETREVVGVIGFSDILSGLELVYVQELQEALEERDQALDQSRRNLQLAEKVIENSLEGIMITDADGVIVNINPQFTRLTGYSWQEAVGQRPSLLRSGRQDPAFYRDLWTRLKRDGGWQGEIWNRRKSGEIYPELLTITAITDERGSITHYAALFNDISELKANEQRIRDLAYYDPLTGLPNRRLFQDRLEMAVAHAHRMGGRFGVIFIDLDRFKRINDSLGHTVGDRLLQGIAERLTGTLREDDTVARLGGDEFVVIFSDLLRVDDVAHMARKIGDAMKAPFVFDREELVVTCSIGISIYPDDGLDMEDLVRNADSAMYRAKDLGRNNVQLYSPEINARSLQHLAMENSLRKALEQDRLELFYQPIVRAVDGQICGAEALLRWNHPDLGRVLPGDFINLAEESGLIIPIGEWALERVGQQLQEWRGQGWNHLRVAVNLSANQFHDPHLPYLVEQVLQRYGITPGILTLELTEAVLFRAETGNLRIMHALRELGVNLALDDFGTGWSSLQYLKRLPIQHLKIDRTFVRDIATREIDAAIVAAIVNLAHSLRLAVVAEGVENEGQRDLLNTFGCEYLQGFLYAQALPAEEFKERYFGGGCVAVKG